MKKVLIATITQGHLSLAQAIGESLQGQGYEIEYFQEIGRDFEFYKQIYRRNPNLFGRFYNFSQSNTMQKSISRYLELKYGKHFQDKIIKSKPDVIISCWFGFTQLFQNLPNEKPVCINILANPRTIHPLEVTDCDLNCVYDAEAKKHFIESGISGSKIKTTGWFIRKAYKPVSKRNMRKTLGLKNKFTIFLQNGSDGTLVNLKILETLVNLEELSAQIIFACGANETLFTKANKIVKSSSKHVKILKFTTKMHKYLQASDLIVGKAGPNTLFESTACNIPFLATSHISGQEDGNLDIIREKRLGWVEEDPQKAAQLIAEIVNNPKQYLQIGRQLSKERKNNLKAGDKLVNWLEKHVHNN